jgi:hypothetical protein
MPFQSFNDGQWENISATKPRSAAVDIIKAIHDLHLLKLTQHHPTTFIAFLIPAVIVNLKDVRSDDPILRWLASNDFIKALAFCNSCVICVVLLAL